MMRLDDEIKVSHTISCECGLTFKNMDSWLTHKRQTNHVKKQSVMYAAIDNEIAVMRVYKQ